MPVNVLSSSGNPIRFSDLNKLMARYTPGLSFNSPVSSSGFRQFITKNIGNTSSLTANVGDAVINSSARGGKLVGDDDPNLRAVGTDIFTIPSTAIKSSEFYRGQILSGSIKIVGSDNSNQGYVIAKFDSSSIIPSSDGYKYFKYIYEATSSKIVVRKTNNPSPPAGWTNSGIQHTQSFKRPSVATKFTIVDNTSNAFTSSFFSAYTGSGGGGGGGGGQGANGCGSGSLNSDAVVGGTTIIAYGDRNTAGVSVLLMNNTGGPTKYFVQQQGNYNFISSYFTGTGHPSCTVASSAGPNVPRSRFAHVMYRSATPTATLGIVDGHKVQSTCAMLLSCPITTYDDGSNPTTPLNLKLWTVPIYVINANRSYIRGLFEYTSQTLTDLLTRSANQTALFGTTNLSKIPIPAISPTTNLYSISGATSAAQFNTFYGYFGYKKAGYYLSSGRTYIAYAELPADATNFRVAYPSYYYDYMDGIIWGTPTNTGYNIDDSTDYSDNNFRFMNGPRKENIQITAEIVKTNTLVKRIYNGVFGSGNNEPGFTINYLTR